MRRKSGRKKKQRPRRSWRRRKLRPKSWPNRKKVRSKRKIRLLPTTVRLLNRHNLPQLLLLHHLEDLPLLHLLEVAEAPELNQM